MVMSLEVCENPLLSLEQQNNEDRQQCFQSSFLHFWWYILNIEMVEGKTRLQIWENVYCF